MIDQKKNVDNHHIYDLTIFFDMKFSKNSTIFEKLNQNFRETQAKFWKLNEKIAETQKYEISDYVIKTEGVKKSLVL